MTTELSYAEHQLIGFAHASKGYDIKSLAESMGMNAREWKILRNDVPIKETDKQTLDELFNINPKK